MPFNEHMFETRLYTDTYTRNLQRVVVWVNSWMDERYALHHA